MILILAALITQMDLLRSVFGTAQSSLTEWAMALAPAIALFFLWELGKLIARRAAGSPREVAPAEEAAE